MPKKKYGESWRTYFPLYLELCVSPFECMKWWRLANLSGVDEDETLARERILELIERPEEAREIYIIAKHNERFLPIKDKLSKAAKGWLRSKN